MAATWRTVRVFISSTFRDMHAERDHLVKVVFPALRERLEKYRVYLVDIDIASFRTRPPAPEVHELDDAYRKFHAARGNDLAVGLRLGELVTGAGLELVEHRGWWDIFPAAPGRRPPPWVARHAMVEAGFVTPADLDRWGAFFDRIDQGLESYMLFVPLFSAIGRRPESSG